MYCIALGEMHGSGAKFGMLDEIDVNEASLYSVFTEGGGEWFLELVGLDLVL